MEFSKADHFRYPDGTDEIVFAVAEGHVLTVREYKSEDDFERSVDSAIHLGTHTGIDELDDVDDVDDALGADG